MAIRGKPVVSAVLALALSACATATPKLPVGGRPVELKPTEGRKGPPLKGELLAVGPERLWILGPDGVRGVPAKEIEQARVRLHGLDGRKAGLWAIVGGLVTGAALAAACASAESDNCGAVFGVTALSWALIGGPSAVSLGRSSQLRVRGPDFEPLRSYARFPQGLPEGLDPTSLRHGLPGDDAKEQHGVSDADLVPAGERLGTLESAPVQKGPVLAPEVLEGRTRLGDQDPGVPPRDLGRADLERALQTPAEDGLAGTQALDPVVPHDGKSEP